MNARMWMPFLVVALLLGGCATEAERKQKEQERRSLAYTYIQLGLAYMEKRDYRNAEDRLNDAVRTDPDYPETWNAMAELYKAINEPGKARDAWEKALSLDPRFARAHTGYGAWLCVQGDYAAAMDQLKKAWEDPLYERPWLALANGGFCADRNGDRKRAEDLLREALRRNPKYGPALVGMARYSIEANNALSARGYLERLKEVARPTAESLWIGIRAEHALGERDAVASQALLLRASFPDSEEAREWQVFAKREGYTP